MISINDVLHPQVFKSDFQVKRERKLSVVKVNTKKYQDSRNDYNRNIKHGIDVKKTRRPFINFDDSANASHYQPPAIAVEEKK